MIRYVDGSLKRTESARGAMSRARRSANTVPLTSGGLSVALRILSGASSTHICRMSWNTVRLELSRTDEFPRGSVSRAYLVRVPVDASGKIDEDAFLANPRRATVRRFWASQADQNGYVARAADAWCFCFVSQDGEQAICRLGCEPLRTGAQITVTEADGMPLPFRIASMRGEKQRRPPAMT